jgi:hypothetical protein
VNEIKVIAGAPTAEEICALVCALRLRTAAPAPPPRRTAPWVRQGDHPAAEHLVPGPAGERWIESGSPL